MFEGGIEIKESTLTDRFADFFDKKIKNLHYEANIDENVYNGRKLITTTDKFFMDFEAVRECMCGLKAKNSEGLDRIPA